MKTPEEIAKEKFTIQGREWNHLEVSRAVFKFWVEWIQLDAWRQGLADAANEASSHPEIKSKIIALSNKENK